MKKYLILLGCSGLMLVFACKNNNSAASTEDADTPVVVEEEIDEIPNDSDFDFEDALNAYDEGDFTATADYIEAAINDLTEESANLDQSSKEKTNVSIATLKYLSHQVREGNITDRETLENVFVQAEMSVAHSYLTFAQVYAAKQPKKSASALKRAVNKMERAVENMEGEAKTEAHKMLKESKELLKKGDTKADEIGNAMGRQVLKMEAWFKKHHKELINRLPDYDPNE